MIIKPGHKLLGEVEVTDFRGAVLRYVYYFNTKTKLVKMYVPAFFNDNKKGNTCAISGKSYHSKGNHVAKVSFVLKGAKLIDKVTRKEIV